MLAVVKPACSCIYFGEKKEWNVSNKKDQIYTCSVHEHCVIDGETTEFMDCNRCSQRLERNSKRFTRHWKDQLRITDKDGLQFESFRGMLAGRSAFLACGGPSTNEMALEKLSSRGCWTLCVNNMAGHAKFRPQAFVCSDPPSKFHNGIWLDPGVMKFIPTPKLRSRRGVLREKLVDGTFRNLENGNKRPVSACHCPNVWGFGRRSWLQPDDTFFTDTHAAWGNHNAGVERTGQQKTVCTMLLGLRLLAYLGAKRIFLVGVDFQMHENRGLLENYSFGEERDKGAIASNNLQFAIVGKWLQTMQNKGVFKKFGVEVFNCFAKSALRAFDYVPFDDAVADARDGIPTEPFDLHSWYKK